MRFSTSCTRAVSGSICRTTFRLPTPSLATSINGRMMGPGAGSMTPSAGAFEAGLGGWRVRGPEVGRVGQAVLSLGAGDRQTLGQCQRVCGTAQTLDRGTHVGLVESFAAIEQRLRAIDQHQ